MGSSLAFGTESLDDQLTCSGDGSYHTWNSLSATDQCKHSHNPEIESDRPLATAADGYFADAYSLELHDNIEPNAVLATGTRTDSSGSTGSPPDTTTLTTKPPPPAPDLIHTVLPTTFGSRLMELVSLPPSAISTLTHYEFFPHCHPRNCNNNAFVNGKTHCEQAPSARIVLHHLFGMMDPVALIDQTLCIEFAFELE